MGSETSSLSLLLLFFLTLISCTYGGQIVVYWGQNEDESSLTETCKTGLYNIVNIAFLAKYGNGRTPRLNLSGHCDTASNNGCKRIGFDIKYCQTNSIKVMISIGGDVPGYTLSSKADAIDLADYIWNNFLGGSSSKSRPFGDVVLDGVDFDIEHGGGGRFYGEVATIISQRKGGFKRVYLTAAPQCPFPDEHLEEALSTGLFDYIWIQFYNNKRCEFNSKNVSKFQNSWKKWVISMKESKVKVYVGVPASSSAAGSGYVPARVFISQVLDFVKKSNKYGGVMLWDRFADEKNGYSKLIKGFV